MNDVEFKKKFKKAKNESEMFFNGWKFEPLKKKVNLRILEKRVHGRSIRFIDKKAKNLD